MVAELGDVRDKLGGDYEEAKAVHTKKTNDKITAERNLTYLNEDFTTTT